MGRSGWRRFGLPVLLAGSLLLSGCSTFSEGFARVESDLARGRVADALAGHEKLAYPPRDRALQLLNRGMLQRLNGDYRTANQSLEQAKTVIDQTSLLSIAEQANSLITNDQLRAYEGQAHERVYLHLIKAMNYLQLGERDSARVEVLQLDLLMTALRGTEPDALRRVAPFAYYFSGLIYDVLGEPSDALISYRNGLNAYRDQRSAVPDDLIESVLQLTERMGLSEENADLRKIYPRIVTARSAAEKDVAESAELLVLVLDGVAPGLRENTVAWPDGLSGRLLRISLPAVNYRRYTSGRPVLSSASGRVEGDLVDDLSRLVRDDLNARLPAMAARSVARQVIKQGTATAVTRAAQRRSDNSGEQLAAGLLSIGMQFAAVLSERADTRSWATLPGRIWLLRQKIQPGRQDFSINFSGRTQTFRDVDIAPGEKKMMVWQPLGPSGALRVAN